ncbi:hypothetical protein ACWDNT_30275, partial [Streptomyces sp. NPDC000963]
GEDLYSKDGRTAGGYRMRAAITGLSPAWSTGPASLTPLVRAVGYCMRHGSHPELREEAIRFLSAHHDAPGTAHHFDAERLTLLGLPGGTAAPAPGGASRLRRGLARSRRG